VPTNSREWNSLPAITNGLLLVFNISRHGKSATEFPNALKIYLILKSSKREKISDDCSPRPKGEPFWSLRQKYQPSEDFVG
jgi:hypothetical protein